MAISKLHNQIMEKLEEIHNELKGGGESNKAAVTKEQLMEIKGVGSSTADEILKLLNG